VSLQENLGARLLSLQCLGGVEVSENRLARGVRHPKTALPRPVLRRTADGSRYAALHLLRHSNAGWLLKNTHDPRIPKGRSWKGL
jgi:hypothetical protein